MMCSAAVHGLWFNSSEELQRDVVAHNCKFLGDALRSARSAPDTDNPDAFTPLVLHLVMNSTGKIGNTTQDRVVPNCAAEYLDATQVWKINVYSTDMNGCVDYRMVAAAVRTEIELYGSDYVAYTPVARRRVHEIFHGQSCRYRAYMYNQTYAQVMRAQMYHAREFLRWNGLVEPNTRFCVPGSAGTEHLLENDTHTAR